MDTWDATAEQFIPVGELLDQARALCKGQIDGVTITGGEPFDQAEALLELILGLRTWPECVSGRLDILAYSGYRLQQLRKHHPEVLAHLDAVITEPFVARLSPGDSLRGSSNQRFVPLTRLGDGRFNTPSLVEQSSDHRGRTLQIEVDDSAVWVIGIPYPGDLSRIARAVERHGLQLGRLSWRA